MKCNIICKFASGRKVKKKMMFADNSKVQALDTLINTRGKVTLAAHIRPDGDALGSTLAFRCYLESRGCDAVIIYSDMIPETLKFMVEGTSGDRIIEWPAASDKALARISESDILVCMDCNSFSRTGELAEPMAASNAVKVLIDHHLGPDKDAFSLVFSETEVSSACELLFKILMSMPDIAGDAGRLPAVSARSMMTGMTTDTNNFANSVFPSTLEMASALLAAGVDRDAVISQLYQSGTENRIRMWGYMLYENLKVTPYGVAYMILDEADAARFHIMEGETEGLVNEPLKIASVRMSIFLKQDGDGFFRVSVRTKKGTSAVGCSKAYFHGGGHENASGGRLFYKDVEGMTADISSPEGVEAYVLEKTAEYFKYDGNGTV